MINNVTLFDISGKLIAEKTKVNAQEVVLANIASSKSCKVTLENGKRLLKKNYLLELKK
jgi:hypothetical protein